MIIHVAETGKSFQLGDFDPSTRVEQVQDVLASLTAVCRQDQLLFAGEARLDSQRTLGCYRLPDDDQRPIFLFNRQRLVQNSTPPPEQAFPENMEAVLPVQPLVSSYSNSVFDNAWDATVRALPSYETQFRYHFQKGNALLTASRNKVDACKKLLREMEVQEMALETVRCSMESHYRSIDHGYGEFMGDFLRQSQHHTEVLANFGRDIDRLRALKLHPALRTDSRQTLLDCVKESCLKKSFEDCAAYHKQLCGKVAVLANEYSELKTKVEDFLGQSSKINLQQLKGILEAYSCLPEEQAAILESLKKDVIKVKKLLEDYVQGRYTNMNVQDAFLGLGSMHDVQLNSHLPRMEECDFKLGKLMQVVVEKKNAMNFCVHQRMQSIALLQASIKLVRNQMSGFREVMVHQDENFEVLKVAGKASNSYKACLAETVRRKAYLKLYLGQAGQLAERMATKREREKTRRDDFLHAHTGVLPQDLIMAMGLFEDPSQCLVDIAPFDTNLLDIDLPDVEKYSLTGSLKAAVGHCADLDEDKDFSSNIAGTDNLEVENARLKAQLASSLAVICSMDSSFRPECLGDSEDQEIKLDSRERLSVVERTAEALRLKDEHAKQLRRVLQEKQAQCTSYEGRIRELEERLREQEERSFMSPRRFVTADMFSSETQAEQSEASGVTGGEPMDGIAGNNTEESSARSEEKAMVNEQMGDFIDSCDRVMKPVDEEVKKCVAAARQDVDRASSAFQEVENLRGELEESLELLRQCQMNSAHLENRLHEAREDARKHLCAADRRASEYNVLRASSVKLRGLLERLRHCIASPAGGTSGFTDSLRALSASLGSEAGDEVAVEFQSFIRILTERVMALAQQRAELMERCSLAEASQSQLRKEAESKADMAKNLFARCKLEKQASKEKICLTRFEVHELALFFPNSAGQYEAINRNCPNYFLSEESVALFREQAQGGGDPKFILGQIVHIEKHVVRAENSSISSSSSSLESSALLQQQSSSLRLRQNPFGLAMKTEYHVVTVAMVPGLHGV